MPSPHTSPASSRRQAWTPRSAIYSMPLPLPVSYMHIHRFRRFPSPHILQRKIHSSHSAPARGSFLLSALLLPRSGLPRFPLLPATLLSSPGLFPVLSRISYASSLPQPLLTGKPEILLYPLQLPTIYSFFPPSCNSSPFVYRTAYFLSPFDTLSIPQIAIG